MKIQSSSELVERLNKLTAAIKADKDLSWTLNSGGCAFFAVRVAKAIKMNVLGIAVFDDYDKAKELFPKVLAKSNASKKNQTVAFWNDNCIAFNHVVIKFLIDGATMYYDGIHGLMNKEKCRELFYVKCYGEEVGTAPVDLIAPLTKTQRGWNKAFRGRSSVERLINGHLLDKWNA